MEKQVMWAVYGPEGMLLGTLSPDEHEAKSRAVFYGGHVFWEDCEKTGYTCKEVFVSINDTESHKREVESLERKAWECSVEMMDLSFFNTETADHPKCHRKEKYNGLASGYKYSAYKLREAFGFPKSETPERFKK